MADHLVHRVVAAYVLAHEQRLAAGGEQAGGVQAAGALEGGLAEPVRELGEERARDRRAARHRGAIASTSSSAPLPQIPQEEVV